MKTLLILFFAFLGFIACNSSKSIKNLEVSKLESDTIRIQNKEIEYDVLIIEPGFSSWFNGHAKPKGFYSQSYIESRKRIWVLE